MHIKTNIGQKKKKMYIELSLHLIHKHKSNFNMVSIIRAATTYKKKLKEID